MAMTFEDALKATNLPEPALAPIRKAWDEAYALVTKNNERVAQVNAAKAQDPNNLEYIDSLWASYAPKDEKMAEVEANYQALVAESEKLLTELRNFGRTKVQPPLSEEETKKVRQAVNESSEAITIAVAQARAMTGIVDSVLEALGQKVEGGIISLMPQPDSLKSLRGRKATGSTGVSYATRIGGFEIDGKPVERDGKTNFRYGADKLSEVFNATTYPENKVTGEQIETAYFEAIEKPFRSLKSTEIPESKTFDFTKEVKTSDTQSETKTVKLTVKRKVEESTTTEVPAPVTANETPKQEVKPEPAKQEAPAKKTVPAPAKK